MVIIGINKKRKQYILVIIFLTIVLGVGMWWGFKKPNVVGVSSFEECALAGSPVMESYPRKCRHDGETFTENIEGEVIESPLIIAGEAKGNWFFEGDFPVILTDWDGRIIAEGYATAKGEWMTEEFVPFTAVLEFKKPVFGERGVLILQKDNPPDNPEFDDALEVGVRF